jgi:transposase
MATMAREALGQMIGGIDTHKHEHVAAVIDDLGRIQGVASFPTTRHGYRKLLAWLQSHGELFAVGVEGCGSWGAGIARYLTARNVRVIEVNRPNRQNRRRRGKSDTVDAEAAARAVLSGVSRPANSIIICMRSCGRSPRRSSLVTASAMRPPVNFS